MWAKQNNLEANMQQLCNNPVLKQVILGAMGLVAKEKGLKGFEQV